MVDFKVMTLLARNNVFNGAIILISLCFVFTMVGAYFAFENYPYAVQDANSRAGGIMQALLGERISPESTVPFFTVLAAVIYSLVSMILIRHFFEQTQSPEILFFALFVISLSLEFARIIIPLRIALEFPAMYVITAARILLFARYLGLFALFAASVYAAGLDAQRQQNALFLISLAALFIAIQLPVDGTSWNSALMPWIGQQATFLMAEVVILIVTVLTFFISAYTRGSKAYSFIGIGTFFVFIGRNMLVSSDTWITPLPGLLLLTIGTYLIASRLRREYMWL